MWFGGLALRGFNFATPEVRITVDNRMYWWRFKEYAANHRADKVLFGRMQLQHSPHSAATHQLLDRAVSDHPLVIHATGEHSLWVNGEALEIVSITDKPVADPLEERYVMRDARGIRPEYCSILQCS